MILSFSERGNLSHTICSLEASLPLDEMVRNDGSFALGSNFTTRSNVLSLSRRTKCRVVCVCMCASMYRNYNDTRMRCTSSLIRNAFSSLAHTLSFFLSFVRSLVVTTLVLCVHFLCLKISRSFLEKAFFPSSFGLAICKI